MPPDRTGSADFAEAPFLAQVVLAGQDETVPPRSGSERKDEA